MKLIIVSSVTVLIVAAILYFTFQNYKQEQVVKQFLSLLKEKKYQDAYKMWGCTQETPCKYYGPEKFNEDWGPAGQYKDAVGGKIDTEDSCGSGVVFTMAIPKVPPFGLWVESSTSVLSYAPWPRCPGRHLQIWEMLKARFS